MAEKMCCLKRGGGHGMAKFEQLHATIQNIYIVEIGFSVSCNIP
jgi:hypothetical protein